MKKNTTKNELNNKLKELKSQIKANSKDPHFADFLMKELLKAQKDIVTSPIELNVGKRIDEFKGEYFEIVKTDRGVLYHEYGGYNVFTTFNNNTALYQTLCDYVDNKDFYFKLKDEEREIFDLNLSAITYCLAVPKFCFSDVEFTYKIETEVIKFLNESYEKAMNEPLQDETPELDAKFEEAEKGIRELSDTLKELNNEINV